MGEGDSRGDNNEMPKIHWQNVKNHWAYFNQTWHKGSLGEILKTSSEPLGY